MIGLIVFLFWILVAFVVFMAVMVWVSQHPKPAIEVLVWIIGAVIFIIVVYNYNALTPETEEAIMRTLRGTDREY